MYENNTIILASASPRRVELLQSAGIDFQTSPSEIDESYLEGERPDAHALRLAEAKARDAAGRTAGRYYIGADTIVVCDGEVMGKPEDEDDAARMLKKLSGVAHQVITAFYILDGKTGREISHAVRTSVFFNLLRPDEIHAYIATGCPMDKAGAYAIQGNAAYMIRGIDGSYTNVVGLPLCEVVEALRNLGAIR
ncbi:MAG: Maf family nucleotide pyrophosphatase [Geobacteraceae bacterium]|nr:Maf family nucleotide pyrophosphatase [Geobacteraceae bacterium]